MINGCEIECLFDTGTSQRIISREVWMRIKRDKELKSCQKSLRTSVGDSVSVLGVASCLVQLGTSDLEVELLVFKKLLKSCLIGMDILANCLLTKESVDTYFSGYSMEVPIFLM